METYSVKPGQNIFDVAMSIYGSIEGLFDLLISNPDPDSENPVYLTMTSDLQYGQVLSYHPEFVLNESVVSEFENKNITPSSGNKNITFKRPDEDVLMMVGVDPAIETVYFKAAGEGNLFVDWGDNSDIQKITLNNTPQTIEHYFDNEVDQRRIRFYGNTDTLSFTLFDSSGLRGALIMLRPVTIDEYICLFGTYSLVGLALFEGTYNINLQGSTIDSLLPIGDLQLQTLDLTNVRYTSDNVLDDYLEYVVSHYEDRRPCTVYLSSEPSESGYAAINTILEEPEWNELETWKFYINDQLYIPENGTESE